MQITLLTPMWHEALLAQLKKESAACDAANGRSAHVIQEAISLQIDCCVATYTALAMTIDFAPTPNMLRHLGPPGLYLHQLFCTTAGSWEAFRKVVERNRPDLEYPTSASENGIHLSSVQERYAYRKISAVDGVTHVAVHPAVPGASGKKQADFLVTAVTGKSVYVEIIMVHSVDDADTKFQENYRCRLRQKLAAYKAAGVEPLLIWADEMAAPRAFEERLNDLRARLDLPTRSPARPTWYEEARVEMPYYVRTVTPPQEEKRIYVSSLEGPTS